MYTVAVDINDLILDLDTMLVNTPFTQEDIEKALSSYDGVRVRQVEIGMNKMFDVDINDYIITLHQYNDPSDLPKDAILLGSDMYMYSYVESLTLGNFVDIIQVYDGKYNTRYALKV